MGNKPKKHHYVPVTYLNGFAGSDGFLRVYRKIRPVVPFKQKPRSVGYESLYYSQYSDGGIRNDDAIEAIFGEVKSKWPDIVDFLECHRVNIADISEILIPFLCLMRVRVPAFRDAVEISLARAVKTEARLLDRIGVLPPKPDGFENILDSIEVSIDPQQSLVAMRNSLEDMGKLFSLLEYDVIHAEDGSFISSDNPIVYYNSKLGRMGGPYNVDEKSRNIEFIFPVTSKMLLRGRTRPMSGKLVHRNAPDSRWIDKKNRVIAKYGYGAVFASDETKSRLIAANLDVSPVVSYDEISAGRGVYMISRFVFGARPVKRKWSRDNT